MFAVYLKSLSAVFLIFALMAVGFVLGRLGWMTPQDKKFLSRYVVNFAVPMNCMNSILNNFTWEDLKGIGLVLLVPFLTIATCLLLSLMIGRLLNLPKQRAGVFVAMAFLSNTMFIGLPMTTQLFGEAAVGYLMMYFISATFYTQAVCLMLVESSGTAVSEKRSMGTLFREIITKPPIVAIIASMLFLFLNVRPPDIFMSFAKYLGGTVSPMALMYCGYVVYELGLKNVRFERGIPIMLVIRLLVSPAICALYCFLFNVQGMCRNVFIVLAALPTVSQITVMCGAYGADEEYSAAGAILSMLGIFITIPVLMVILT